MVRLRAALTAAALLTTPALAQEDGRAWALTIDEGSGLLFYGTPESDDLGVSLACDRGSGQVRITFLVDRWLADRQADDGEWQDAAGRPAPWPAEIGVEVGEHGQAFDAGLHPDLLNEGSMAVGEAPAKDLEALVANARGADVALEFYAAADGLAEPLHEWFRPPPAPAEAIRSLLEVCEA